MGSSFASDATRWLAWLFGGALIALFGLVCLDG